MLFLRERLVSVVDFMYIYLYLYLFIFYYIILIINNNLVCQSVLGAAVDQWLR